MKRIGLVDLAAEYREQGARLSQSVADVARAGRFVLGPAVASFEAALARHCGFGHAVGVASGTDALALALRTVGVGRGDVVVTSPLSFVATAEAVVRLGAVPCFVDVDGAGGCLGVEAVARFLERCEASEPFGLREPETGARVAALLPVHLYGRVADLPALWALAAERALPVVEDAAQAVGARVGAEPLGRRGPVCVSFFPTKNLGGWGDGGAVLSHESAVAERVRSLRVHGATAPGVYGEIGANSRLDALQAAILETKLTWLDEQQRQRRHNFESYQRMLAAAGLGSELGLPPALRPGDVVHQYTVRVRRRRDELRAWLDRAGIETAVYYPRLLCDQPALATCSVVGGPLSQARTACAEVLSLPVHPYLEPADLERVVEAVRSFFRGP